MKKLTPLLFAAVLAAGCATKTISVHVSEPRAAVPVQSVVLEQQAPPGSVLIADLYSDATYSARGAEAAQADMKKSAAAVGANVLVVVNRNADSYVFGAKDKFRIEGHAYFAPPVNK